MGTCASAFRASSGTGAMTPARRSPRASTSIRCAARDGVNPTESCLFDERPLEIASLLCPRCGVGMKLVSVISEPRVVDAILGSPARGARSDPFAERVPLSRPWVVRPVGEGIRGSIGGGGGEEPAGGGAGAGEFWGRSVGRGLQSRTRQFDRRKAPPSRPAYAKIITWRRPSQVVESAEVGGPGSEGSLTGRGRKALLQLKPSPLQDFLAPVFRGFTADNSLLSPTPHLYFLQRPASA